MTVYITHASGYFRCNGSARLGQPVPLTVVCSLSQDVTPLYSADRWWYSSVSGVHCVVYVKRCSKPGFETGDKALYK